jgi:hypothetical protein
MTLNEKLRLFGMILSGRTDEEMEEFGYCYRERSEMRAHLVMHGYLDEVHGSRSREASPFEAQTSRYQMTPSGETFLAQIYRRMTAA